MRLLSCRCLLALAVSIVLAYPAAAQNYPTKPIRVIVPFEPGGTTDTVLRIVAPQLGESLGVPIVVENRAGGAATIGTGLVASAAPDGYTLGVANIAFTANPSLVEKLPYDPEKDFVPVGLLARNAAVLAVHPKVPARSVQELIALAKAKPDTLTYASAGFGSTSHLGTELFKQLTGVPVVNVQHKGGGPQVISALSGQTPVLFAMVSTSLQYFHGGQLIPLAIWSAKRDPRLPNVPTFAEAGVPSNESGDDEMGDWVGIIAPKGTPDAIVKQLNQAINKVIATPAIRDNIYKVGAQAVDGGSPEALANYIHREIEKWRKVTAAVGINVKK